MNNIGTFFKDESGQYSAMRLSFVVWSLGVFGVWAAVSIIDKSMAALPKEVITMVGLTLGAKVFQSFSENFSPK